MGRELGMSPRRTVLILLAIFAFPIQAVAQSSDFCSPIIALGKERASTFSLNTVSTALLRDACKSDFSKSSDYENFTHNGSVGLGDFLGIKGDNNYGNGRFQELYKNQCTKLERSGYRFSTISGESKTTSEVVVEAWRDCVLKYLTSNHTSVFAIPQGDDATNYSVTLSINPPANRDIFIEAISPSDVVCLINGKPITGRVGPNRTWLLDCEKNSKVSRTLVISDSEGTFSKLLLPKKEIEVATGSWKMEGFTSAGKLLEAYSVNLIQSGIFVSGTAVGNWDKDKDDNGDLEAPISFDIFGELEGNTITGHFFVPDRENNKTGNFVWNLVDSNSRIAGTIWSGTTGERPWSGTKN